MYLYSKKVFGPNPGSAWGVTGITLALMSQGDTIAGSLDPGSRKAENGYKEIRPKMDGKFANH